MTKKTQKRGKCIFCEGGNLSKEHIWARWIHPYLPRPVEQNSEHSVRIVNGIGSVPQVVTGEGKLSRPGSPQSQRLRVVCETCNNGWMSRIQNGVKNDLSRLIQGEMLNLSEDGFRLLANWATMFAFVWETTAPELRTSSPAERAAFMQRQMPPPDWHIWVSTYSGKKHHCAAWRRAGWLQDGGETLPHQSTTFGLGKVAFHTMSTPLSVNKIAFAEDFCMYKIWPEIGPSWNLGRIVSDNLLDALVTMPFQNPKRYFDVEIENEIETILNLFVPNRA